MSDGVQKHDEESVIAQPVPTPELEDLSKYDIKMIYAGLLIPNTKAVHKMAREILRWRGEANPDAS